MNYSNISYQFSAADLETLRTAIQSLREKMPFLITLTPKERQKLPKMGEKSVAFVQQCLQAVQDNPDMMPAGFKADEFERDVKLAGDLLPVLLALQDLAAKVDDTLLAVGSEAMRQSSDVYAQVKVNSRRNPAMKATANQLATRFKSIGANRKKASSNK